MSLFADPNARSSGASLSTADGRNLSLVGVRLRGDARGGLARLVLEQRFENSYAETLDVTYRMPLPADGAVSAYEFEIGGRVIVGKVDKKAAARETFERAVVEGRTAALLEQNTNDIFTQQIGNLPPNETLVARITIDQRLAWLPEGEWELRFPTVIGPRYVSPSDTEQVARDTHVSVDPSGIAVGIQIAITIGDTIVGGRTAASPTHTLVHRADGSIELKDEAALDRDIVVRWPVATAKPGLSLDVARRKNGDAFGLLTIVPPSREAKATAVARDLIVLLDTSGSMSGGPLDKAKVAVALLVESLGEQDRLELIEFSNSPRRYKSEPVAATEREKAAAIKWIKSRSADGGTEMASAVYEALHAIRPNAQRQVVLVTDGYIGGEQQIIKLLHENLPKSCRMHVLGVGSAVNRSLATSIARAGRGVEVLCGLDEDAERAIKRMVDRTKLPMLTNVTIVGNGVVRQAPEHLPDVYEGSPIVAALQVEPEGGEVVVRGELAREPWEYRVRVPARQPGDGNQAICALYAREHVADLETRWNMGDTNRIDREIETTGVEFQIATRLTSWVAVDMVRKVEKRGTSRHENVPQNLPYGTKAESFGLRSATAGAPSTEAADKTVITAITARSMVLAQDDEYLGAVAGAPDGEFELSREESTRTGSASSFQDFEAEESTGKLFDTKPRDEEKLGRISRVLESAPPPMAPAARRPSAPSPKISVLDELGDAPRSIVPEAPESEPAKPAQPAQPSMVSRAMVRADEPELRAQRMAPQKTPAYGAAPLEPAPQLAQAKKSRSMWMGLLFVTFLLALIALLLWWLVL